MKRASDEAGGAEGVVTDVEGVRLRVTDDDMVDEFDLDDPGGFIEGTGNPDVGRAGGRIAGWVFVGDDQGGGSADDGARKTSRGATRVEEMVPSEIR